eukprot:6196369-Pleurochrysis_carterae.AAC.4
MCAAAKHCGLCGHLLTLKATKQKRQAQEKAVFWSRKKLCARQHHRMTTANPSTTVGTAQLAGIQRSLRAASTESLRRAAATDSSHVFITAEACECIPYPRHTR